MKKLGTMLVIAGMITCFVGADAALAGRVGNRQFNQQKRIHQGIKSGELTRGEIRQLKKEQIRIQRHKHKAWSDGKLTPRERVMLKREQDRASRHIYRLKHNDRER
jgi:hypothetical protein